MGSRKHSVAVVGAGGNIGSQLVPHLARMSQLRAATLIDPDDYEQSNLTGQSICPVDIGRSKAVVQARKMRAISPGVEVISLTEYIENVPLGLLKQNIFLGALDSKLARMRMNRIAARLGSPIIDAGIRGDGMLGRITVCNPTAGTACLECGWSEEQYTRMHRRTPCMEEYPAAVPTNAPSELGGLVSSYLMIELRKLLERGPAELSTAYQILIDLNHHVLRVSRLPRNPKCRCNHRAWTIKPLPVVPDRTPIGELLGRMNIDACADNTALGLDSRTFAFALTCPACGARRRVTRFLHRIPDRRRVCPRCGGKDRPRMLVIGEDGTDRLRLSLHRELHAMTLERLGFRTHDVITVRAGKRTVHCELLPAKAEAEGGGHDEG